MIKDDWADRYEAASAEQAVARTELAAANTRLAEAQLKLTRADQKVREVFKEKVDWPTGEPYIKSEG